MKSRYAKEFTSQPSTKRIYPNGDKNASFAKSYNWLMRRKELSPGAKHVYNRLGQYAGEKNCARVKQETLAIETGFCLRQVKAYIKELVHFGLIEVQQFGLNKANLYYFLDHPWKYSEVQDPALQKVQDPALQKVQDPALQKVQDPALQKVQDPALPLNRSYKKIQLIDHTQKKESVFVPPSKVLEPSSYPLEEWRRYAANQKNIASPEALARNLVKSKENDPLMKQFLELERQQQQKLLEEQEAQKQKSIELEQEKLNMVSKILSQGEPFSESERSLLLQLGYCFAQTSH